MGPFDHPKWVVCHGNDSAVHYVELPAGQVLSSGQPQAEAFDTEAEAEVRAIALGHVFSPVHQGRDRAPAWDAEYRYHPGDRVRHQGKEWVATSHNRGNEPDDVPGDWDAVA